ncbi:hypothetical protein AGMMS49574_10360 [Bacteroidia bacterium]|nr:hypothetical protein AGMMS49574_10360 [Bacteroidia bacterium]
MIKRFKDIKWMALLFLLLAQVASIQAQSYIVDNKGVIREKKTHAEVSFYGVNYTLPFSHSFRMHKALGVDLRQAIDKDVYHFARLGFNAYRIHLWDIELSDLQGNLVNNEHLDLFDYLVYKLKERNIKLIITGMTVMGNGYPERDDRSQTGFASKFGKREATSNEDNFPIQENYLKQLVSHVNPYTKIAYKDDPAVVGFEINNEPNNSATPALTTTYINRMAKAIRSTGTKALIFYNVSHNFQNTQAFYNSQIDGGTFQWYPTGLVAGFTRKGNFLPAVDTYPIPFDSIRNYNKKALIVYEMDAADVADPYIYPAISRSFRTAGFQWVTQFAYDAIEIAWMNTEYQTHFLNLAYSPQKAISIKIAAEALLQLPRKSSYGSYPQDTIFGPFRVSYNEKLSELNTDKQFMYSNNTSTKPKNPATLTEIAGYGNSPVVTYEGTGAYFLDKLGDGVWRLELLPDAIWLQDPFGRPSPKRIAATVLWNEWPINIRIPDLGSDFTYEAINASNVRKGTAQQTTLKAYPGVYLLKRKGVQAANITPDTKLGVISIKEYVAPQAKLTSFKVLHQPEKAITAGKAYTITAQVVGPIFPDSVIAMVYTPGARFTPPLQMKRTTAYTYTLPLTADQVKAGNLSYTITAYSKGKAVTYPADVEASPSDWDYFATARYTTSVEPAEQFLTLLNVTTDFNAVETYLIKGFALQKTEEAGASPSDKRIRLSTANLKPENQLVARLYIKDKVDGRTDKLSASRQLSLKVGKVQGINSLELGFITTDGYTYRAVVPVKGNETVTLSLDKLTQQATLIRPTAYPSFLPDYFTPKTSIPFDVKSIEILEVITKEGQTADQAILELSDAWLN